MARFHIRRSTSTDILSVVNLISELQEAEHTIEPNRRRGTNASKKYFKKIQKQLKKKTGRIFIAEQQDKMIGLIILFIEANDSIENPGKHLYIADIVVAKDYQQQGIGKELIRKAEAFAQKHGIGEIRVNSLLNNTAALDLYHKVGFHDKEIALAKTINLRTTKNQTSDEARNNNCNFGSGLDPAD